MEAHFFDLDVLLELDSGVWIVSKTKPKEPIIRISQSEFNLIRKGVYKKFNSPLNISGQNYWLPENLYNSLKIRCLQRKFDITDLSFSMQEFMNPEIIEKLDFSILHYNFIHLKNTNDDIYIICSKASKSSYETIIKKLEKELFEIGLKPKNYYFISETFYNKNADDISHKKVRLVLQHLIGHRTDGDKFTNEEVTKYSKVSFYDDDLSTIKLASNINSVLDFILSNTDAVLKSNIKSYLKDNDGYLVVNQITGNKVQPFKSNVITLKISNLIKTFESFIFKF
jgi:hypothetical protein